MVYTVYIKILVGENMSHSKDATHKVLLVCKDIFADVINGFIFSGDEKVKAEDLVCIPADRATPIRCREPL